MRTNQRQPERVVAALKAKGIDVSEGLVYSLKPGKKKGKKATSKTKTSAASSSNGILSVGASITEVKALAGRVGGVMSLKEIVDALV